MTARGRFATAMTLLAVAASALAVGCGQGNEGSRPRLTVSAATSLTKAFTEYAQTFRAATVRLQFAGSDELAAQIRQGVRPDVYAAANTKLPEQLFRERLVDRPVAFAANRLVIAVPAHGSSIESIADLARPGVTIAAGAPDVPVGAYARAAIARLPPAQRDAVARNIRSSEPDVGGVVAKVAQGAVDAGLVYITDVRGATGRLRAVELPASLRPRVRYAAAVVRGAGQPRLARAFIAGLLHGTGASALREAGFAPAR